MSSGIPDGITREDVLEAVENFNSGVAHPFLQSTTYDLLIDGTRYPPKAILGLAARRLAGRVLVPRDFRGGEGTRCFQILRTLGFEVVAKAATNSSPEFMTLSTEEPLPDTYREGTTRLLAVNVYERNPRAREACIDHYGTQCAVCGFDFEEFYGEIGKDYIHVHHLRDLATIGREYEVDPIADLRPVCPNCHAMLHSEVPAMSIGRLRQFIASVRPGCS